MTFFETVFPGVCCYLLAMLVSVLAGISRRGENGAAQRRFCRNITYMLCCAMVAGVALSYFLSYPGSDQGFASKSATFFMLSGLPLVLMGMLDRNSDLGMSYLESHFVVGFLLLICALVLFALGVYNAYALSASAGSSTAIAVLIAFSILLLIGNLGPVFR